MELDQFPDEILLRILSFIDQWSKWYCMKLNVRWRGLVLTSLRETGQYFDAAKDAQHHLEAIGVYYSLTLNCGLNIIEGDWIYSLQIAYQIGRLTCPKLRYLRSEHLASLEGCPNLERLSMMIL